MTETEPVTTRRSLHGVAELLLAGPQHRATGRIDLRVVDGGFATAAGPDLRVEGDQLLTTSGRFALNGRSYDEVAAAAGLEAGEPAGVYGGGPAVRTDEVIALDAGAVKTLLTAFAEGERALREFAPGSEPILWPEHFDVAISLDEVNYGVSPGDGFLAEPYAYVGPFERREGEFWNAPFGAARTMTELGSAAAVVRFFRTGRDLASGLHVEIHSGPREVLRPLFELAEDSPVQLDSYLGDGRVLVAVRGDTVIGHLQLVETGKPGEREIKNMAVREDHQGQGVGGALVNAAVELVTGERGTQLVVATAAADIGNLRFYQRQGFRMRSIERDAFTPATGYPAEIRIDGIELRDRVWLDRSLLPAP
ncbi:GNAT family N-acetyltransferase [Amycolatopsis sp. NPDC005003]